MTTENVRIAVRDAHDSETLTYMDNSAVGAIHFDKADLTRFFEGDTTALVMRINNKHPEASFVTVGNKLSFVYKNRDYWLNISQTGRDGYYKELVAFSLTWELYKEKMPAYTSPKAMTIAEIIKVIDSEGTLEIGINEMPDKKMVFSWDGIQNKKDRLYSAANQIGAELGLVTETNDDYSLKRHVINIYKEHTDTHQGLGQDKRDTTLRVGKELKVINQKDSADEFYTAIRATGKDGLSIVNLEFEERDDDGNILYFSKKGDNGIRALQARNKIPSNTNKKDDGYLFDDRGETEYTTVEALKGYMLSELKKISQIKVDYETQGYFDSDPGDTFSLEDSVYYNPPLYLEARVYEQTESLVLGVTSSDRTTFTNFVQKESEINNDLLARMRKLIEANKVFTYEIITSDGVTFKNGFGSTTLTARVRDGIKDVTDTFSLKWYKDGTLFSNTKTVTINAADIEEKAVFRFEVADDSGNVRGGAEVTVTNIDDGKKGEPGETYYPHRGYLMADGTFTKAYPNENLFRNSESPNAIAYAGATSTKTANLSVPEWNAATAVKYAISGGTSTIACTMPAGSMTTAGVKENYDISIYIKNTGTVDFNIGGNITTSTRIEAGEAKWVTFLAKDYSHPTGAARQFSITRLSVGAAIEFIVWRAKFAYGTYNSIWTPRPDEDYENAYPKYEGFYSDTNQVGSDNPDDYKPWIPFMGPQGKDGYTPVKNVDYFDGQPGQNGKSAYLWIRYSQNADGSGMTTDPANAKYTGYATTETNVAPTSPSVYKWQQTKGDSGIGIPGEPGPDGKTSYLHIKYSNDGGLTFTGNGGEDGGDYIGQYVDFTEADSKKPSDYTWSLTKGSKGDKGDPAPLISLSGTTQAITVDKDGKITPASSFSVTGTAVNTAISNWTYSLNGGNFGSAVPTGVTRAGNTVTIDPSKAVFDTFTIKAADATVSDVFTISRIKDGGEGPPGSDAYTVFLTNESYTFAGSTTAALAGSTTTEVIVYKGINKITPTSITVGTKPTGLSSSVSGSVITLIATTALVSKSGIVPVTIIADGKTFTKQFSYALSLQGATGNTGKGVTAEEISYAISQDGTTPPTSGWSGTRPTPKAGWYMWTRTRFKYTDNTYSAYFYLVAQQGKDAIVISDTAPANPTKGTLWQDSSVTPQIIKVFNGTVWSMWGMPIDNLLATNILSENGVFKRLEGAEIVNTFSYTDSGVTYTGTTTMKDGNVTIARTGSDGSTWTTTMDRVQGFVDTYKASSSAPARTTQLGQGKLYMVESGVGGYLPAAALNPAPWVNIPLASGFVTIEGATPQYRRIRLIDGSYEVQLRGRVGPSSGNFDLTGRRIGSIPYPASMLELFLCGANSGRSGRMQVELNGDLMVASADSGVTYISLSGIRFVSL
ncbi:hypothetical protein [Enterococcus sp. AZ154]|uniref:hypothetical protein n=1 Tax=Enterococcus sp. AZ154 TaxID=2774683 RepID=UPI003D2BBD17